MRLDVPLDLHIGDTARLRKPHPCGSYEWEIVRVGADIGIRCRGCGRRVLLPRREFRRRAKSVTPFGGPTKALGDSADRPPGS